MRSPVTGIVSLIILFIVLAVGYSSVFTVQQTEQTIVLRFGEPVDIVTEPGLHFKAPWNSVINVDKRILDLENPSQEVIASDQKRLVVDAFARYRIKNALRYYTSVGSIQAANLQLTTLLNAALRRVLGEVNFITVVRDEREKLMSRIREQLDREADGYGIEVVDVRIRRARPAGAEQPGRLQPDEDRARTRGGRVPCARRPEGTGDPLKGRSRSHRDRRRGQLDGGSDPRRGRCRAQPPVRGGL
ncbi:membrane protease subunit HflC [Bradyrhizobium sp. USDA 3364]